MRTNGSVFERECNEWNVVGCKVIYSLARDVALLSKAMNVTVREKYRKNEIQPIDLTRHNDWIISSLFSHVSCLGDPAVDLVVLPYQGRKILFRLVQS